MDRSALAAFSQAAATQRRALYGVKFQFREVEVDGTIAVHREPVDLERGGFSYNLTATIRFPVSIQPPPAIQEPILEISTDRTWFVITPPAGNTENPLCVEHVFEVSAT